MSISKPSTVAVEDALEDSRKAALLDAAFLVFARFGYRKTSMDEVARAAGVSRQGLYLLFANKDDLFRSTLRRAVSTALAGATEALSGKGPIADRLQAAFDSWSGRYVGRFTADARDILDAAQALSPTLLSEYETTFLDVLTAALRESRLANEYKATGVAAREIGEHLLTVAKGLKHSCESREEFNQRFAVAVRLLCAPLA